MSSTSRSTARVPALAAALGLALSCAGMLPPPPTTATLEAATGKQAVEGPRRQAPIATPAEDDLAASYWANRTDLLKAPALPAPTELPLAQVVRWKLRNGLDVMVVPRPDLPVVSLDVAVRSGAFDEGRDDLGIADFAAAMLRKGTDTRSADAIARAIDFVGGNLDTAAGPEHSSIACTVLSKDAPVCLDLVADLLLHPAFPEAEMAEVRAQLQGAVRQRYGNSALLAVAHFDNLVFGEDHPAGRITTVDDIGKIKRDDVVRFWRTHYRPNNSLLVIAGAVDPVALRGEIDRRFASWKAAAIPARAEFHVPERKGARFLLIDKEDLPQATVMFGHRGLAHRHPDWYAATMMNYVLGGADVASRLTLELRARRGLVYGISSSFGASLYDGTFRVTAATRNESVWECLMAAVQEIRRIRADGPTESELAKGRGFFAGSYPFRLQSAQGLAANLLGAELHGLGVAYVKQLPMRLARVDVARAKQAAQDFLQPDALVVVIVGRADLIAPVLEKNGMKYERISYRDPPSYVARGNLRRGVAQSASSGDGDKARALLQSALVAQGGANLRNLKELKIVKSGERRQGGVIADLLVTTYYRRPDRVRVEQSSVLATGKSASVYVVTPTAVKGGAAGQRLRAAAPIAERRLRAALFEDPNFFVQNALDASPVIPFQLAPPLEDAGRVFDGVVFQTPAGEWTTLYFDRDTHLLARIKSAGEGGVDQVELLDDYREVGGIKFAHQQTSTGHVVSRARVTEIKVNPGLDPSLFE